MVRLQTKEMLRTQAKNCLQPIPELRPQPRTKCIPKKVCDAAKKILKPTHRVRTASQITHATQRDIAFPAAILYLQPQTPVRPQPNIICDPVKECDQPQKRCNPTMACEPQPQKPCNPSPMCDPGSHAIRATLKRAANSHGSPANQRRSAFPAAGHGLGGRHKPIQNRKPKNACEQPNNTCNPCIECDASHIQNALPKVFA